MISTPYTLSLNYKYTCWTFNTINLHLVNHIYLFLINNRNYKLNTTLHCSYYKIWQKNLKPLHFRYSKLTICTTNLLTSKLTHGTKNEFTTNYLISLNTVFAKQLTIKQVIVRYTLNYIQFALFQQSLFLYSYLRYFIGNTSPSKLSTFFKTNQHFCKKQTTLQIPSLHKFL